MKRKLHFSCLDDFLRSVRIFRIRNENVETKYLLKKIKKAKNRGYLKKSELQKICRWKSRRVINLINKNTERKIKKITQKAFKEKNEKKKMELLIALSGVHIPMASAILMFYNPNRYGVIDVRVWTFLHRLKAVNTNPDGKGFTMKEWLEYLYILRKYAKLFKVRARDIERTLWDYGRKIIQTNQKEKRN